MPDRHIWHDLVMTPRAFDDRHGVYHLSGGSEGPRRQALAHGWHAVVIDTSGVSDKDGYMMAVSEAFDFPSSLLTTWTGLDDCLRAVDRDEPDGLLVIWDNWGDFAEADPDGFESALQVLQDACVAWRDDDFQGAVLLNGPGPDTDLMEW